MRLKSKKIILGITGSIAAYKAAMLLRLLVKESAEVQVVITQAGKEFITPVTLSALSGKPVISEFFGANDGTWNSHVDLGLWADLMLVAPATASTIAKMANGIADNMLVTTYMSAKCPVFVAPAMDLDMFAHPSTQKNIEILKSFGNSIIEPSVGELASGLTGKGREWKNPKILLKLLLNISIQESTKRKTFLVTAGPTYEKIDPVRFLGNFSSGKMGYAISEELADSGANVILVSGPVSLKTNKKNIQLVKVESADEMYVKCLSWFPNCDGAVMCAAVADFTPVVVEKKKTKRGSENWSLELQPTIDIAAKLGELKSEKQILAGFALETNDEISNAKKKLESKNLDFIVLNSLNEEGAGFQVDTNKITIIDKSNNQQFFELKSKKEVAVDIVNKIKSIIK
ncbi:MAG: bifunctional phosphopantothenoylcysteine decarboxylase/phosphopantothenate--cysteine ligase CoaBC [Draconibacterium sp.]|nr:bifunctional phosphopantothenoylcysteine decarboxylase/phosphopantothenate--cysteine ligase CoaBC [Draconibacterium sp.]